MKYLLKISVNFIYKVLLTLVVILAVTFMANAQTVDVFGPGNGQTFTVPAGVTSITVQIWGGGGGGASDDDDDGGGGGGGGGYSTVTIAVVAGQVYTFDVGAGGAGGAAGDNNGGNGNDSKWDTEPITATITAGRGRRGEKDGDGGNGGAGTTSNGGAGGDGDEDGGGGGEAGCSTGNGNDGEDGDDGGAGGTGCDGADGGAGGVSGGAAGGIGAGGGGADSDGGAGGAGGDGAIILTYSIVLPIELISLDVSPEVAGNLIKWSTATEVNNNYFILEKSDDGIHFTEITKIQGAGNSQSDRSYEYSDNVVSSALVYYRLTQVDYNGASTVFPVIAINNNSKISGKSLNAILYPNPTNKGGIVNVKFNEDVLENSVLIVVVDVMGKQQYLKAEFICCDTYRINTDNLSSGVYYIIASQKDNMINNKLVVR